MRLFHIRGGGPTIRHYVLLKTKRFTVSVNRLTRDARFEDIYPHDHGSDFFSVALRGGYTEELFRDPATNWTTGERIVRRFPSAHKMDYRHAHKADVTHPVGRQRVAWTLFVTWNYQGTRSRVWTEDGPIDSGEYWRRVAQR